ncbi:hypothetical protein PUNSTDRAFT_137874 [Punctularia strigosozonata HHB-11173 SS5]|uniref:Uncharacterized protein n=1 Tax=Punctularia strigosozonata (strain HHB-11173) TaxID=741275 RepID=R7S5G3_PUNST|nr:uncharacterized protein PUNSTDRAFT_137874 [Punctularia strigosozonata HHB-11173 SS5]EIN05192.1 hypothetical protein PUNSTDRAFT_137874 [Punctularia strigosozonata HHB-11173 SS5]
MLEEPIDHNRRVRIVVSELINLEIIWSRLCRHSPGLSSPSAPTISAYLVPTLSNARVRNLALERDRGILPSFVPGRPVPTVETALAFHNAVGPCRGLDNLVQNSEGEWKAHTVLMMLDEISGHEEDQGGGYAYEERTVTWGEVRTREVEQIEREPEVVIRRCSVRIQ